MMGRFDGVVSLAVGELRERSRSRVYQCDPHAWLSDVLGKRWWSKQEEVVESFLGCQRVGVKSGNGVGKSALMADLVTWWVSVFPPEEVLAIISAPTLSQIEKVIFAYLKTNFGLARLRGFPLRGEISEELTWRFVADGSGKKEFLAFGKRPSDRDIVSSFQGTRALRTFVALDEAGGVPRDLFTAAEAVATGAESRILAIGNPDRRGTAFHELWLRPELSAEWALHNISVFDLPTFTGERVYVDDAVEDVFRRSLTSVEWVEHKRRVWGEGDARWVSKVLGEFPDEGDDTFFGQQVLDKAYELELPDDASVRPVLGVDVARFGEDESVVYVNGGGRVRLLDVWGKADTIESARRVHGLAVSCGAGEVRVDSAGIGGAVFDALNVLEEFAGKTYRLVGVDGGARSPDPSRWANARAFNHDVLRMKMLDGLVDLDFEDRELREQLLGVSFRFNSRGAVQITPKDELKTVMGGSPDRLDAVVYAVTDVGWVFGEPGEVVAGSRVVFDPAELLSVEVNGAGMPW
jgi:hypothetical protein